VIQLDDETEKEIDVEFDSVGGKKFLAMLPENCQDVLAKIRGKVMDRETADQNNKEGKETPLVLQVKKSHLRYHIKKLIELEFPRIAVLTQNEIDTINVQHAP
jgi:type III secretory pathway component EscV